MNRAQLSRLKALEKEKLRLRRAVSELTLEKPTLTEAARKVKGVSGPGGAPEPLAPL